MDLRDDFVEMRYPLLTSIPITTYFAASIAMWYVHACRAPFDSCLADFGLARYYNAIPYRVIQLHRFIGNTVKMGKMLNPADSKTLKHTVCLWSKAKEFAVLLNSRASIFYASPDEMINQYSVWYSSDLLKLVCTRK